MSENQTPVKFLIIRLSGNSNILLSTPLVGVLKQEVANAEIHYLTKPEYVHLLEQNPHISKIHQLTPDFDILLKELKYSMLDYMIDLQDNLRTLRIKNKLGIPTFKPESYRWRNWLLVNFKIKPSETRHLAERYLQTGRFFISEHSYAPVEYKPTEREQFNPQDMGLQANGYVAFMLSASHYTRKLPPEKLIEICRQIKYPVVLLTGRNDSATAAEIAKKSGCHVVVAGDFTFGQSAAVMQQARRVAGHESGLMQLAAAFGKESVLIRGNTVAEFGISPYKANPISIIVEVESLKCRPCTQYGFSQCPKKHFKCMQEIDIQKIVDFCNG